MPLKLAPADWTLSKLHIPKYNDVTSLWQWHSDGDGDNDDYDDKRSESSDDCYKEDMKGGGPLSTDSNNGGNSWTGCINRPLHFNSRRSDRNLMEAAVFKLIR
jgi:hypothetical protein